MREQQLRVEQVVNAPIERVFAFFADASNLEAITPAFLRFRVETPLPIQMRSGAVIDYSLRLHGVRFKWRTLIDVWEPGVRFVDRQLKGPYTLWVHEHTFTPVGPDQTLVKDHVRYSHAGWALAPLVHRWFVRPRLDQIFAYRAEATRRLIEQGYAEHPAVATRP